MDAALRDVANLELESLDGGFAGGQGAARRGWVDLTLPGAALEDDVERGNGASAPKTGQNGDWRPACTLAGVGRLPVVLVF